MKVLIVHNKYRNRGGEETVVQNEYEALKRSGNTVGIYSEDSRDIKSKSSYLNIALQLPYNLSSKRKFSKVMNQFNPDIVHVHNLFPLISPSIIDFCWSNNIPVVMTFHNYRLLCINGLLMRNQRICELCPEKGPQYGILHSCYQSSKIKSLLMTSAIHLNKCAGTWSKKVTKYICLTEFARSLYIKYGFDKDKLVVKPNFVSNQNLPQKMPTEMKSRKYDFVFVGRLSKEKGIDSLLKAHEKLNSKLLVIGGGPLLEQIKKENFNDNLIVKGPLDYSETLELIADSRFLVLPSIWYEGLPQVIIEAFSRGTPVIASRLGGPAEVVDEQLNGFLIEPGNVESLKERLKNSLLDVNQLEKLSINAYNKFQSEYTEKTNINILENIYKSLLM